MPDDLYIPDDDHPCYRLDGERIDTERVLSYGNEPEGPGLYATQARLLDRLGEERAYGLFIRAGSFKEARQRARIRCLGEVVTGEVVAIIPAGGEADDGS